MAGVVVDAQQNGFSGRGGGLQWCGHLRWVKGRDARICDAGGEQHGGIRGTIFHRLITVDHFERLVTGGVGDGAPLGFLDCAHVVCAIADAARHSKAGITRVVFILSSSFFAESGGLPHPQFSGHEPSGFTTIRTRVNTRFHALLLLLYVLSATASSQRISHECGNSSTPRRTGPSRTDCSRLPGDSWERIESPAERARCAYGGWGWRADVVNHEAGRRLRICLT